MAALSIAAENAHHADLNCQARPHWIDPSAWISGVAFAAGVLLAGGEAIGHAIANGSAAFYLVPAAYAAFLVSVLIIQRHMRKSMLASTFGTPQRLTTGGIFKYSRNPIYVAFLVPLAALAAISAWASAASIVLYILLMNRLVISKEERELSAVFGAAYLDYMARTPRWLV
jgi:protein-S-isoprenylcysteine O-methyltransferase Ste14